MLRVFSNVCVDIVSNRTANEILTSSPYPAPRLLDTQLLPDGPYDARDYVFSTMLPYFCLSSIPCVSISPRTLCLVEEIHENPFGFMCSI